MTSVTLEVARRDFPNLVRDVMLGGHVLITDGTEPVAQLIPVAKPRPTPVFGSARGLIEMADDFDEPLA